MHICCPSLPFCLRVVVPVLHKHKILMDPYVGTQGDLKVVQGRPVPFITESSWVLTAL